MQTVREGHDQTARFEIRQRTMRGLRPLTRGEVLGVIVVCLGLGMMGGIALGIHQTSGNALPGTSLAKDYIYLTVAFNPATGLDEYFPANFTVPAGVPIVFTITNYDNGTNPVPKATGVVHGTVDGTETVYVAGQPTEVVSSIPADRIVHTFTIQSSGVSLNVPIPPAASVSAPTVVTFTAVFANAGSYTWECLAPCDPSAMATPGFMTGTLTVVSG